MWQKNIENGVKMNKTCGICKAEKAPDDFPSSGYKRMDGTRAKSGTCKRCKSDQKTALRRRRVKGWNMQPKLLHCVAWDKIKHITSEAIRRNAINRDSFSKRGSIYD